MPRHQVKTVRKYLQELPEPYRSQALQAMPEIARDIPATSLTFALSQFVWQFSPQGFDYWFNFRNSIIINHRS